MVHTLGFFVAEAMEPPEPSFLAGWYIVARRPTSTTSTTTTLGSQAVPRDGGGVPRQFLTAIMREQRALFGASKSMMDRCHAWAKFDRGIIAQAQRNKSMSVPPHRSRCGVTPGCGIWSMISMRSTGAGVMMTRHARLPDHPRRAQEHGLDGCTVSDPRALWMGTRSIEHGSRVTRVGV